MASKTVTTHNQKKELNSTSRKKRHVRIRLTTLTAATSNYQYLILISLILLLVILSSLTDTRFLRFSNIMNVVKQTSVLAIVGIGMTFVLISGGVDLSVGSNIAFASAVGVLVFRSNGNALMSMISIVLAASFLGLVNGINIGVLKITPFMATLSTLILGRGLTLFLLNAESVPVKSPLFLWIGQADLGPFPVVLLVMLILYICGLFMLQRTIFGRRSFAVGANRSAARAVGINVEHQLVLIYLLSGFIAGLAAVVTIGRLSSVQPWAAQGLEFEVITAVVIGGTSLMGGKGSLLGTFLGSILIGTLSNYLTFIDIPAYHLRIVRGAILIIAVGIDRLGIIYREKLEVSLSQESWSEDKASEAS